MTENHLSQEQLAELIYGDENAHYRVHLANCRECGDRYGELTTLVDCLNRMQVPQQTATEKTDIFLTAWQSSNLPRENHSPRFLWPVLRHAASFGFGLACGILLLVMTVSPFEAKGEQAGSKSESIRMENPVPPMLQGTPAAQVYSQLENPVIVQKKGASGTPAKRILEGTAEDGKIQIVWNL